MVVVQNLNSCWHLCQNAIDRCTRLSTRLKPSYIVYSIATLVLPRTSNIIYVYMTFSYYWSAKSKRRSGNVLIWSDRYSILKKHVEMMLLAIELKQTILSFLKIIHWLLHWRYIPLWWDNTNCIYLFIGCKHKLTAKKKKNIEYSLLCVSRSAQQITRYCRSENRFI